MTATPTAGCPCSATRCHPRCDSRAEVSTMDCAQSRSTPPTAPISAGIVVQHQVRAGQQCGQRPHGVLGVRHGQCAQHGGQARQQESQRCAVLAALHDRIWGCASAARRACPRSPCAACVLALHAPVHQRVRAQAHKQQAQQQAQQSPVPHLLFPRQHRNKLRRALDHARSPEGVRHRRKRTKYSHVAHSCCTTEHAACISSTRDRRCTCAARGGSMSLNQATGWQQQRAPLVTSTARNELST